MNNFNSYLLPETTAFLTQCSTQPSATWTNALNTFIRQCIINGNWQKFDRCWIFATTQQQHARVSIVNPTPSAAWPTSLTEVPNGGTLTWTALQGYTGDGTKSYINSNYNPAVNNVNFSRNNCSIGIYSRTNTAANGNTAIGMSDASGTDYILINPRNAAGQLNAGLNGTAPNQGATSDSLALKAISRSVSTTTVGWDRGVSLGNTTSSSLSVQSFPIYILATNKGNSTINNFTNRQLSMAFIGSAGINQSKLYNNFQSFATTIGFNV